ncbi:MAG: ABC transporter ATP-binding protein [Bdellovibrionales bacterium]|nr:ABC transporter ATP-binding protein [Bdellovibrionales bacterium]
MSSINQSKAPSLPRNPLAFAWWATQGQRRFMAVCWIAVLCGCILIRIEFTFIATLIDNATAFANGQGPIEDVYRWVWYLLGTYLLGETLWRTSGFSAQKWMTATAAKVYDSLFAHLTGHSTQYFHERFAGAITNKISNAAQGILGICQIFTWQFIILVTGLLSDIYLLYTVHYSFAVVLSVWLVIFCGTTLTMVLRLRKLSFAHAEASSKLKGKLVDTASNIESVHQQAEEPYEHKYVGKYIHGEKLAHRKSWFMFEWILVTDGLLLLGLTSIILLMAIRFLEAGAITIGTLTMLITVILNLEKNLFFLGDQMSRAMQLYGQIDEGLEEILKPHEITNSDEANQLKITSGAISYNDVDFRYGATTVFSGLSLSIGGAQKIGLVGPSGAGKSTFVNLLLRLYDVPEGQISIDGQDLRSVTLSSLRKQIALVPQSSTLFHRTIAENIRYGRLDATHDEVIAAAKLAQAHEFIEALPDGYDTFVGERGVKLSGGQRQRVSIARAILKDAPILVLDEATSSLDSESESAIQDALRELMQGRTVIAIAHRLSTLQQMDRIVVLENGKIIEDGSHEALLARNGLYASLWKRQVGGFIGE